MKAPSNGTYATLGYDIVDSAGNTQSLPSGVTTVGTAEYSIPSTVAVGTYAVSYVSGLELSGTNAANYFLAPYPTPTSVIITSASQAQTVTWSPANTAVTTNASPLTPNPTASTTAGGGAISYSILSDGGTGCTVNASTGVLTFAAAGDCVVRAYAAGNESFASAYKDVVFTVSAPLNQTVAWAPTNTEAIVTASPLTPNATASTSGNGAISYSIHEAGGTGCTVDSTSGVLSFTAAGDCVVRATAAGTTTEATAYKDVVFTISVPTPQTVTWSPTNTSAMTTASPLTPSAAATSTGTGAISYAVHSAGTTACTVNASTGQLTFSTAGDCVVRATAAATSTESSAFADVTFTVATSTTSMVISIDIAVGTTVANAPVSFATTGLQPGAGWDLVVRSTPQTLASGSVGSLGAVTGSSALPSGLAPGWHSLTLAGTRVNGGFVSSTVWFEVSSTGDLVATQASEPDQPVEPDVAPAAASEIAHTGFAVAGYVTVAALLVLLGGGTVIARRRNAA